ncbi:MAG: hypothetical protein ACRDRU_05430 [Pseudonocardiaceae bacterium]
MIAVVTTPARDPARAAEQPELAGHDGLPARAADVRALEGDLESTPWSVPAGQTLPVRRWEQRLLDAHH